MWIVGWLVVFLAIFLLIISITESPVLKRKGISALLLLFTCYTLFST